MPEAGRGDAGRDPQPPRHRPVRRAGGIAVGDAAPTGLEERVRAQPQHDQGDREQQADQREEERARELRDAERAGHRGAGAGEVGADDAADGGRPDDDAEVPRAVRGKREVGCGIAALAVGGGGTTEQDARDEQQREVARRPRR